MENQTMISRRAWLGAISLAVTAGSTVLYSTTAGRAPVKTPPLSAEEIAAIEAQSAKKGLIMKHRLSIRSSCQKLRMIFLYYYGKGAADELAKSFRAALDVLGKTSHGSHSNH